MSNKTIAKNTLFLYIRMLFNMGVTLYTSRIVLEVLGVSDFGVYSLVMGVVILFSFFNGTMTATTQRFINVEKASGQPAAVNKIFNLSIINHLAIIVVVISLAESVGLWFLNQKLNIPAERMDATNVVYQIALAITLVEVIKVPFNAMIVAYERMQFFAWLGLAETLLKLLIVFVLMHTNGYDKLIGYAWLLLGVSLSVLALYVVYVKSAFKQESRFHCYKDGAKIRELLSFSGWMLFGQLAVVGATQGLSMVANLFFGVVVNAAIGIANQVDAAVYSFVGNFQVAFNPQLVQSYANNERERNQRLILNTSKYAFYLMAILSAPVLYFTHSLLTFWLGNNLPPYVEELVQAVILCSLINAMAGSFWMTAMAIGSSSIKQYNIVLTLINLFTVPLAYYLFTLGFSPVYAFIGKFAIVVLMQLYRLYFINRRIAFDKREFRTYLFNISMIFLPLLALIYFAKGQYLYSFGEFIWQSAVIEGALIGLILLVGLSKAEQTFLIHFIKRKFSK